MKKLSFHDALKFLDSKSNFETTQPTAYNDEVMSPERPRKLLGLLSDPHLNYPVVLVAGTKGKGSVSAMVASVLQAAGHKVGLFTSPDLQGIRERIRINGVIISEEEFAESLDALYAALHEVGTITRFEVLTALAYLHFSRKAVDIAIMEIGLGGRLDATNVVDNPLVSVITTLGYDHQNILGETLTEITREKAGIIKNGSAVVSAPQREEAMAELDRIVVLRGAELTLVGRDVTVELLGLDPFAIECRIVDRQEHSHTLRVPLTGAHQATNAAVALAVLQKINDAGLPISDEAMTRGFASVDWPGRFEVVRKDPWMVLDGAHNRESAESLRAALDASFPAKRRILVVGVSEDKDVSAMLAHLLPGTAHVIATRAMNPRACEPIRLAEAIAESGLVEKVDAASTLKEAIALALDVAGVDDVICVTGSLFVVGEARTELGLQQGEKAVVL